MTDRFGRTTRTRGLLVRGAPGVDEQCQLGQLCSVWHRLPARPTRPRGASAGPPAEHQSAHQKEHA